MNFQALDASASVEDASTVCIGTGRFLRAVLVPALSEVTGGFILAQPRGHSFCEYLQKRLDSGMGATSEVDTGTLFCDLHRACSA